IAVPLSQPVTKAAFDYWNALRNGAPVPRRRAIDPHHLRAVLPNIMLLDRVSSNQTVFRLAGTAVCQAFGRGLRDPNLFPLWDTTHRGLVASAVSAALGKSTPVLIRCRGHALGQPPLPGEWLLLPLLDDRGHCGKLLGSFAYALDGFPLKAFTRLELL